MFNQEVIGPFVFFCGGMSTYIYILNRYILHLRNGIRKMMCILGGFVIFGPGFLTAGIITDSPLLMAVPGSMIILGALLEFRRMIIQKTIRGESPVCSHGSSGSLMKPVTTMNLRVCRFSIPCHEVTTPLRISLLSDLHLNEEIPHAYYHRAVDLALSPEPDCVFLTGDFVTSRTTIPLLRDVLEDVSSHPGCYAVLGNHDHWVGPELIADVLEGCGIRTLRNEDQYIAREDGSGIVISGCEDPWGPGAWIPPGNVDGSPVFVLSHTPDNIYRLSTNRVTAVFSGHYHGGQMRMPGIGGILIPSIYGKRFEHGHFVVNGTHLFVSAGIGVAVPPVRVFSRPDILVIELYPTSLPQPQH